MKIGPSTWSIITSETRMFSTIPPSTQRILMAPSLQSRNTQLVRVMLRNPPAEDVPNLNAAVRLLRIQLVITTFSVARRVLLGQIASSPVVRRQLLIQTSRQPSRSKPSRSEERRVG